MSGSSDEDLLQKNVAPELSSTSSDTPSYFFGTILQSVALGLIPILLLTKLAIILMRNRATRATVPEAVEESVDPRESLPLDFTEAAPSRSVLVTANEVEKPSQTKLPTIEAPPPPPDEESSTESYASKVASNFDFEPGRRHIDEPPAAPPPPNTPLRVPSEKVVTKKEVSPEPEPSEQSLHGQEPSEESSSTNVRAFTGRPQEDPQVNKVPSRTRQTPIPPPSPVPEKVKPPSPPPPPPPLPPPPPPPKNVMPEEPPKKIASVKSLPKLQTPKQPEPPPRPEPVAEVKPKEPKPVKQPKVVDAAMPKHKKPPPEVETTEQPAPKKPKRHVEPEAPPTPTSPVKKPPSVTRVPSATPPKKAVGSTKIPQSRPKKPPKARPPRPVSPEPEQPLEDQTPEPVEAPKPDAGRYPNATCPKPRVVDPCAILGRPRKQRWLPRLPTEVHRLRKGHSRVDAITQTSKSKLREDALSSQLQNERNTSEYQEDVRRQWRRLQNEQNISQHGYMRQQIRYGSFRRRYNSKSRPPPGPPVPPGPRFVARQPSCTANTCFKIKPCGYQAPLIFQQSNSELVRTTSATSTRFRALRHRRKTSTWSIATDERRSPGCSTPTYTAPCPSPACCTPETVFDGSSPTVSRECVSIPNTNAFVTVSRCLLRNRTRIVFFMSNLFEKRPVLDLRRLVAPPQLPAPFFTAAGAGRFKFPALRLPKSRSDSDLEQQRGGHVEAMREAFRDLQMPLPTRARLNLTVEEATNHTTDRLNALQAVQEASNDGRSQPFGSESEPFINSELPFTPHALVYNASTNANIEELEEEEENEDFDVYVKRARRE